MTALTPLRARKDRGMEGMVAKWYATNTGRTLNEFTELAGPSPLNFRTATPCSNRAWPGLLLHRAREVGPYSITGLDISHTFVEIAGKKAAEAGVHVEFRQGNASSMPFANDTFDFLLCCAAFKNFGRPVRSVQEMCRVLKPWRARLDHRSESKGLAGIDQ